MNNRNRNRNHLIVMVDIIVIVSELSAQGLAATLFRISLSILHILVSIFRIDLTRLGTRVIEEVMMSKQKFTSTRTKSSLLKSRNKARASLYQMLFSSIKEREEKSGFDYTP